MRKKAEKRSKDAETRSSEFGFKQRVKAFFAKSPAVIAMKKKRDRIADKLLQYLLACFALVWPCWSFFFIGTPKKNDDTG